MHSIPHPPYSLDTVRLTVPVRPQDLNRLAPRLTSFYQDYTQAVDPVEYRQLYFMPLAEMDLLRSDWTPPAMSPRESSHVIGMPGLDIQFSIPKTLYGHNARHEGDLPRFCQALEIMLQGWGFEPAPWDTWLVRRFDLSYNFEVPNAATAQAAIQQLSLCRYRGAPTCRDSKISPKYPWAYWKNNYRTTKFYCKGAEICATYKSRSKYPADFITEYKSELYRIVRYEEEHHAKSVIRFCKRQHINDCTVGVVSDALARFDVAAHIAKIARQFDKFGVGTSVSAARELVQEKKRKSRPYLEFLDCVIDNGLDYAKTVYAHNSFYRMASGLRDLGIEPAQFEVLERTVPLDSFINIESLHDGLDDVNLPLDPLQSQIRAAWDVLQDIADAPVRVDKSDEIIGQFVSVFYSDKSYFGRKIEAKRTREERMNAAFDALTGS